MEDLAQVHPEIDVSPIDPPKPQFMLVIKHAIVGSVRVPHYFETQGFATITEAIDYVRERGLTPEQFEGLYPVGERLPITATPKVIKVEVEAHEFRMEGETKPL